MHRPILLTAALFCLCGASSFAAEEPKSPATPNASPAPAVGALPKQAEPTKPEPSPEEKARLQVEQLRAQSQMRLAGYRNAGWVIRPPRDTTSGRERMLLFLPGGPLLVDLNATIDGQPYWTYFETLLDEMLAAAPQSDDGGPQWEDVLKSTRVARGPYSYIAQNPQTIAAYIKQNDLDGDGRASREEVRAFLTQIYSGSPFMVSGQAARGMQPPVVELLDTDGDGTLSAAEMEAAPARLRSRDANDDELVDLAEFGGNAAGRPYAGGFVVGGRAVQYSGQTLMLLDEQTDFARVQAALTQRYGQEGKLTKKDFSLVPKFFAAVDADNSGDLSVDELKNLLTLDPHLRLNLRLGQTGDLPGGLTVERAMLDPETTLLPTTAADVTTLELPGVRLQLAGGNPAMTINYNNQVQSLINAFDADKNGYLDKEELAKQQGYARQFDMWDLDSDGKVYPDEMKKAFERSQAPQWHRVTVGAIEQGNSLFGSLDANSDGRLSLREVALSGQRLRSLDKSGDGNLSPSEVPVTVRVAGGRSNMIYQYLQPQPQFVGYRPPGQPAAKLPGPEWFHRMDRNNDGDLSPREFLGEPEQFRALDANNDGLIELSEAEAAEKK